MLHELVTSSNLLCTALERYYNACFAIQKTYARGEKPHNITPQLPQRMSTELELATSLEVKLRQAKVAIGWSINRSHKRVSINDLPPELLVRIFRMVHKAQPCMKRDYNRDYAEIEPMYPTILSLVCTHWREIALNTPSLWSHLDISTSTLLNRHRLDGLVSIHLNQSGQLPLDLHIFDPSGYEISFAHPAPMWDLITQAANRVASFDLDLKGTFGYGVHSLVLSTFFENCVPGKLRRLTLVHYGDEYEFIGGQSDSNSGDDDNVIDVGTSTEDFEDILSHVSVLRLQLMYLPWNSRAYHGLIELRLTGWVDISESELIGILQSSPELRIFQFGLPINGSLPSDSRISPIPLNNLEALNLEDVGPDSLGRLLRWLAPGPKPLQFAAMTEGPSPELMEENTRLFFLRSRVTRVYGNYQKAIPVLLDLSPNIQEIAINSTLLSPSAHWECIHETSEHQLECLYIANCSVNADIVLEFLNHPALAIRAFSFYRCRLTQGYDVVPGDQVVSYLEGMARSSAEARFIIQNHEEPNPVESWDLFASYQTPLT